MPLSRAPVRRTSPAGRRSAAACAVTAALALAVGVATSAAAPVRVVRCPTRYGLPERTRPLPRSLATHLPASRAGGLALYGNNLLRVLAPAGWHCSSEIGADGSSGMAITHAGQEVDVLAVGYTSSVGAGEACRLFADADANSPVPCTVHPPAGEHVVRVNATTVLFEDPPHVHGTGIPSGGTLTANGVMRFDPSARGFFFQETCTLPASEHALCTTLLNDAIARAPA